MKSKSLLLALLLAIVGTMQTRAYTLYYYNTANYKYAVWYWTDGTEGTWSDWMTAVSGHSGWYQVTIPNNYNNVIFTSFSSSRSQPNWNYGLSQTADLKYDGVNAYYVEGKGWQNAFEPNQQGGEQGSGTIVDSGTCGDNLRWTLDEGGTLTISGKGAMYDFSRYYLYVSPTEINAPAEGGEYTLEITSNATWSIYSNVTWITCNLGRWKNNGKVTVTVAASKVAEITTGVLTISQLIGDEVERQVTITRSGSSMLTPVIHPITYMPAIYQTESGTQTYEAYRNLIKMVAIQDSVTRIGNFAFYACSNMTSIEIPNSVTTIGENAFDECSSLTSVTIPNSVTSIGNSAFSCCSNLTSITIPNSVTNLGGSSGSSVNVINFIGSIEDWCNKKWNPADISGNYQLQLNGELLENVTIPNSMTIIGSNTFNGCKSLKNVVLPSSIKTIEDNAFAYCNIQTITCYGMRPPSVATNSFADMPYSTIIYVPADYLNTYIMHDFWGQYDVQPIEGQTVETDEVKITPSDNTADIIWPEVAGAASYELVIKDKQGNTVCTLTFNAQGQLTQIAFRAPARGKAPQQTQATGFSFTITGLEQGTTYDYTLTAKDATGNILDTKSGTFTTDGITGIEDIQTSNSAQQIRKVQTDGQILILLPDGRKYTPTGTEVK